MIETEAAARQPRRRRWAMLLLAAGVALIGGSLVWPMLVTGRAEWSDELAVRHQAASRNLHELSHRYSDQLAGARDGVLPDELRQAQHQFSELSNRLDAAKRRPAQIATVLGVAGVALSIAGAIAYFAAPRR